MTCLEKYLQDHPGKVVKDVMHKLCPHKVLPIGHNPKCGQIVCEDCWNREIPEKELTVEEKRTALMDFCGSQYCGICLHQSNEFCDNYTMEDAPAHIIHAWYAHFFGTKDTKDTTEGETVNHPGHYNREGAMECLDEMVLVFGVEATMHFCLLNAWKYRYRAADKNGIEDLKKSDWYLKEYSRLASRTDFTRNKVQSCEDPSTQYVDLGGIRLILHEGRYVGWFRC
jgi:hypothetical protein